jgi:2-polyprenyl-3-methyl-5-hydroxy-6-metoxy-1,4-benzoquinol methylase
MKAIDKFLRYWRVKVALNNGPKSMTSVFDIGCDDGYLLRKLAPVTSKQDGIDPRLCIEGIGNISKVKKGFFPASIEAEQMNGSYDAIFALAVFEHFTEVDIRESASVISKMLSDEGRLVVTVPHPFVDKILDVLMWLRLIDGQALEEHHEFNPETLLSYFSESLKLVKRQKFQFGLNNIFVFERYSV